MQNGAIGYSGSIAQNRMIDTGYIFFHSPMTIIARMILSTIEKKYGEQQKKVMPKMAPRIIAEIIRRIALFLVIVVCIASVLFRESVLNVLNRKTCTIRADKRNIKSKSTAI